jgi:hypothetical protein
VTTRFLGDVFVGGNAEVIVGGAIIEPHRFNNQRGALEFNGRIVSNAPISQLNLIRAGLDELALAAALHVQNGQSLELLLDGVPMEMALGPGAVLTGDGTLLNPVTVAEGAAISPGNSAGILTFGDDLVLGGNALYRWEINDAQGDAGGTSGGGWDFIRVLGSLRFEATDNAPFVVELVSLDDDGNIGPVANLAPGYHRWQIAEASNIAGFDPTALAIDASQFIGGLPIALAGTDTIAPGSLAPHRISFRLEQDGGNLYVVANVVPEPNALTLCAIVFVFSLVLHVPWRSSRKRRHSASA